MNDYLPAFNFYSIHSANAASRPAKDKGWFLLLIVFLTMALTGCRTPNKNNQLHSPNGSITVTVFTSNGRLMYKVELHNKIVLDSAPLGINIYSQSLGEGVSMGDATISHFESTYRIMGVHDSARNHYTQANIPVVHKQSNITYQLQVSAFNDGIAFRYVVPQKNTATVTGEASSWKIPAGSNVWYQENVFYYEGLYYETPVEKLGAKQIGPPLTYQTPDSNYVSITEAALYNYSGMSLRSDSSGLLHAAFVNDTSGWKMKDTIVTPWRVAIISKDLDGLVNSDIVQNLNPAPDSALQHANWIKPGKAVWSYFMHENVTTAALERAYIDKAAKLGFAYTVVDAGWESSWPNCMDSLKALVNYARERNVAVWVWKSYESLKNSMVRLAFFEQMQIAGVAGLKIDFIDKEGIDQVQFYEAALKDAADHRLMIDFHGANKPTGINRTYPNELTREAVYGQEWTTFNPQGPKHNAILPFTRMLAGPADATPGVFNSKKAYGTSRAHQLALQVIFNSVLSCWPADPDAYLSNTALPFIKNMPTTWDETVVLPQSSIGKVAAFARRKGDEWFIGIINAGDKKTFKLPLQFLGKGNFRSTILQDDLTNADSLLYSHSSFTANDSLLVAMNASGGFAAMLTKENTSAMPLRIQPQGGYLIAPVLVHIQAAAGTTVRYTTDGSVPNAQSALYSQPITISKPALVRAIVLDKGISTSITATAQFLNTPAPTLSSPGGLFIDRKTIFINAPGQEGTIHYTLDGSQPGIQSPVYKDSLVLTKSVTMKAATIFNSGLSSETVTAIFNQQTPAPAINNIATAPGLKATFFKGEWKWMPDFKKLVNGNTSIVSSPALALIKTPKEYYAVQFTGFIKIPVTGVYQFYILSDDGSKVLIDDAMVVDNNGCHGDLEKSGEKGLAAGLHRFRVNYFQNGSGQSLKVLIKAPGKEKVLMDSSFFVHQPVAGMQY